MRKQSPKLEDLGLVLVFVRVVDQRSFSAAARALGTTTSAVSKRVARLEDRLGTRLLSRTTRHVTLTEAGAALYERGQRVLAELESAEIEVSRHSREPRGLLRVNGPVVFGERAIAPMLPELAEKYPELRVELSLTDRFVDVVREGWDVVVRIGRMADSSLMSKRIGGSRGYVVAAPSYLEKHGEPKAPEELVSHDCIRYSLITASHEWRFKGSAGRDRVVTVTGHLTVDHGGAACAAAVAGLGVAVLPGFICAEELESGELREILPGTLAADLPIHAVWPHGKQAPKVTAFVELLAARLKATKCA